MAGTGAEAERDPGGGGTRRAGLRSPQGLLKGGARARGPRGWAGLGSHPGPRKARGDPPPPALTRPAGPPCSRPSPLPARVAPPYSCPAARPPAPGPRAHAGSPRPPPGTGLAGGRRLPGSRSQPRPTPAPPPAPLHRACGPTPAPGVHRAVPPPPRPRRRAGPAAAQAGERSVLGRSGEGGPAAGSAPASPRRTVSDPTTPSLFFPPSLPLPSLPFPRIPDRGFSSRLDLPFSAPLFSREMR